MSPEYLKLSGRYSQVLSGTLRYSQVLSGTLRYSQVFSGFWTAIRFTQALLGTYSAPRALTHWQTTLVRSTCCCMSLIFTIFPRQVWWMPMLIMNGNHIKDGAVITLRCLNISLMNRMVLIVNMLCIVMC